MMVVLYNTYVKYIAIGNTYHASSHHLYIITREKWEKVDFKEELSGFVRDIFPHMAGFIKPIQNSNSSKKHHPSSPQASVLLPIPSFVFVLQQTFTTLLSFYYYNHRLKVNISEQLIDPSSTERSV